MKLIKAMRGTRDIYDVEALKFNFIEDTAKELLENYGFGRMITPTFESTDLFKRGIGEGTDIVDKEMYTFSDRGDRSITLRPEGTAPVVRSYLENKTYGKEDLTKYYYINNMFRYERPQAGRYREFYQCDADVIGSNSLLNELELIQIIDGVFDKLNLNIDIKLNNRKILSGIAEIIGKPELLIPITVAIDKLDKIGEEKVMQELSDKGLNNKDIETIRPVLFLKGKNEEILKSLRDVLAKSEIALSGIEEMEEIFALISNVSVKAKISLDLTLARGLNYYTGTIIEVQSLEANIGSICGGGRYDDLTGIFGLKDVSGVGISFGADRIYEVIKELNKFPTDNTESLAIMFTNFGKQEAKYCLPYLNQLRHSNIPAMIFPDSIKISKQLDYANKNNIPFVILAGESEMQNQTFTVKNMIEGTQKSVLANDLLTNLYK